MRKKGYSKQKLRLIRRNTDVRKYFEALQEKNPHWKTEYVINQVADKFYLSERTITAIITNEGNYGTDILG